MKYIGISTILLTLAVSSNINATVCNIQGKINSIIPSIGVTGLRINTPLTGCLCDYSLMWIDIKTGGGKAMYSAALAAKLANKDIQVTIEDGQGQGAPGNDSISYRYWSSCKLHALEVF